MSSTKFRTEELEGKSQPNIQDDVDNLLELVSLSLQ